MTDNPLKESIAKRTQEERLTISKDNKKPWRFNFQILMMLSIIFGLIFSLIRIIAFFF